MDTWADAPAPGQVGKRVIEGFTQRELPDRWAWPVSTLMHWGYGTSAGAAYGVLAGSLRRPKPWYGVPFGALVWASGYVILPEGGLYKPIWEYDAKVLGDDLSRASGLRRGHRCYLLAVRPATLGKWLARMPSGRLAPPGTERPRRYLPKLRYELIGCGLHGHELLGTDAARLRAEDAIFAREDDGLRWYRCLRCDSWLPLNPPGQPTAEYPPPRDDVVLPLRGRPLRDRYVLRLIALDRALHFLVLGVLSTGLFLFANNKTMLHSDFTRILKDLQGGLGGPVNNSQHGIVHDLQRLFAVSTRNLYLVAAGAAAYAALEGCEAVGLWLGRRWAEYLTFIATVVFVPYEIYELTKSITWLKVLALVINLVIVIYLLLAKRLFGLRGGGKAEQAERDKDYGWPAIERATPRPAARVAPAPAPEAPPG